MLACAYAFTSLFNSELTCRDVMEQIQRDMHMSGARARARVCARARVHARARARARALFLSPSVKVPSECFTGQTF
jgi:hypothetical protein